ncbi:MAG: hypothetical protein ACYTG6_14900, partial [Planctomycetota bacterium]
TASREFSRRIDAPDMPPLLAADHVVVVGAGRQQVDILLPDPLGGLAAPVHSLRGNALQDFLRRAGGTLRPEARVYTVGSTLVVMLLGRAGVFAIDDAALLRLPTPAALPDARVLHPVQDRPLDVGQIGGRGPYLIDVSLRLDGFLIASASLDVRASGISQRQALWFPAVPSPVVAREGAAWRPRVWNFPDDEQGSVVEIRRTAPTRQGPWLFLPTDRGVRIAPVRTMGEAPGVR